MVPPLDLPAPPALAQHGRVATLGMFIIDHFEVHDADGNRVPADQPAIGGGGVYAMAAARMFLPARNVGLIVDAGDDMPPAFATALRAFGPEMLWLRARAGRTTRALNVYSGHEIGEGHQTFEYLTPRIQLFPRDFLEPPSPFTAPPPAWFHVVCDVDRAGPVLDQAEQYRAAGTWAGHLAWEPLVRAAAPIDVQRYAAVAQRFAIFSPNHLELQMILGAPGADVEACARLFREHLAAVPGRAPGAGGDPHPAIVVRAGADGAFTLSTAWTGWVPAYWRPGESARVVDPTGGGNAFMGGLLAGLLLHPGDHQAAALFAAAAASFAIEQRGIPSISRGPRSEELWNSASPWARLRELAERTGIPQPTHGI